jgi:glycine cleavage system H protein
VIEVNDALAGTPEKLNVDLHGEAWLIKVRLKNAAEVNGLLTAAEYQAYLGK